MSTSSAILAILTQIRTIPSTSFGTTGLRSITFRLLALFIDAGANGFDLFIFVILQGCWAFRSIKSVAWRERCAVISSVTILGEA